MTGSRAAANPADPVILVFGDSLSAEYGLRRGSGWVGILQERLRREGLAHRIMNASISGETTAGGLARLPAALGKQRPMLVILQLGANDGLRGLSIAQTRRNLQSMIELITGAGAAVVLVGMRIPPNYGADYTRQFDGLFADIARTRNLPLVPFLLEGIADNPQMFQADTIHPNEKAQSRLFDNVWPVLAASGLLTRTAR
jgi:acyl-CoA thioesterase-1